MRNILDFIHNRYHWFIFILLEVVSLTLLFQNNSYQGAVWTSSANTMAGTLHEGEATVTRFFTLNKLNKQLTHRNIFLEHQVAKLTEELDRKGLDSLQIAGLKQPGNYKLIPAEVVANSVNKKDNLITINKGEADGVRKDMGVISGNGVVGIVYLTGAHYSVVIPILSSLSSISCMIERRGYFGYMRWEGGASNLAYLDDVPRHAHFKLYDRVVTSGYSSVFPQGIAVGKIIHVFNSADGISYRAQVQLYTDFANLRDVCVIDNSRMKEQLDIMRQAQDSLATKKE